MNVEEAVELEPMQTQHEEPHPAHRPSDAQRAAVVEAAYILEALRK